MASETRNPNDTTRTTETSRALPRKNPLRIILERVFFILSMALLLMTMLFLSENGKSPYLMRVFPEMPAVVPLVMATVVVMVTALATTFSRISLPIDRLRHAFLSMEDALAPKIGEGIDDESLDDVIRTARRVGANASIHSFVSGSSAIMCLAWVFLLLSMLPTVPMGGIPTTVVSCTAALAALAMAVRTVSLTSLIVRIETLTEVMRYARDGHRPID